MNEIYWITRLDLISGWLVVFAAIAVIFAFISACFYLGYRSDYEKYGCERDKRWQGFFSKVFKISLPCFFFFVASSILTPTTNEALMIFGVGGTIDYIKSNETINKLPDKCVKALDAWVDSLTKKESKNEN